VVYFNKTENTPQALLAVAVARKAESFFSQMLIDEDFSGGAGWVGRGVVHLQGLLIPLSLCPPTFAFSAFATTAPAAQQA
jgi:hypothetical protein